MLTIASRVDVMNRLGRAMADGTRSRILLRLVTAEPEGRRTRYEIADPHLTQALAALVGVVLAVDEGAPCLDGSCDVPECCDPP